MITGRYEILDNKYIFNMEDLINYCLTYGYDIEIPKEYNVTKIYNIVFTTGNFDPEDREMSNTRGSILYSHTDIEKVLDRFEQMCKDVNKEPVLKSKYYYCWQTEDYAVNQIVHSYKVCDSYIVEEIRGRK